MAAAAGSPSDALDAYYLNRRRPAVLDQVRAAQTKVNAEIAKRKKLIGRLEGDRAGHGNAVEWKRIGDLLLAIRAPRNAKAARSLLLTYDEGLPRSRSKRIETNP